MERYNPHIVVHTDELWELLVKRHFRQAQRNATESWREMYARCNTEKDAKLLVLADRLKQKRSVMPTGRQIQMAFVDTAVKPPREVVRAQKTHVIQMVPTQRRQSISVKEKLFGAMSQPVPAKGTNNNKKAPLMARALKMGYGGKRR